MMEFDVDVMELRGNFVLACPDCGEQVEFSADEFDLVEYGAEPDERGMGSEYIARFKTASFTLCNTEYNAEVLVSEYPVGAVNGIVIEPDGLDIVSEDLDAELIFDMEPCFEPEETKTTLPGQMFFLYTERNDGRIFIHGEIFRTREQAEAQAATLKNKFSNIRNVLVVEQQLHAHSPQISAVFT